MNGGISLKRIIIFSLFFLFTLNLTFANENYFIQGISIIGLKNVSYDVVQNMLNIKVLNTYDVNYIEGQINKLKESGYFKFVSYELKKLDVGYDLIIKVEEFPVITDIIFPDIKLMKIDDIKKVIYSGKGKFFIEDKIKEDCEKIEGLYRSKGFVLEMSPQYIFKDGILTFIWKEAPILGNIEIKSDNQWEKKIIEDNLNLSIGDPLDLRKIDELNQKLLKKNIRIKIIPEWAFEEGYTILYLNVDHLSPRVVSLSYERNERINLDFSYYLSNYGNFYLSISNDMQGSLDYLISWQRDFLKVYFGDNYWGLSIYKILSNNNNIVGEIGFKNNPNINDKVLNFNITQDSTLEEDGIYKSGSYFNFSIDFHGGGSNYNYSLASLSGKYFIRYGESLNERILGFMGDIRYPFGDSPEDGALYLKITYAFPLNKGMYLTLSLGGDSCFNPKDLISASDIRISPFFGMEFSVSQKSLFYAFGLESNLVSLRKFYIKSKLEF